MSLRRTNEEIEKENHDLERNNESKDRDLQSILKACEMSDQIMFDEKQETV